MAETSGVVNVDYCRFFSFPPRPSSIRGCITKCKTCSKNYKHTLTTKGTYLNISKCHMVLQTRTPAKSEPKTSVTYRRYFLEKK